MRADLEAATTSGGEARLDHLLAAWRVARQPELARLVVRHAETLPPSLGADPSDLEAWHALAPTATARQRGELLGRIDTTKWARALDQLEVIAQWPADPRTVDTLRGLIDRAPYRSHPSRALWSRVYAMLGDLADPRSAADLPDPQAYGRSFPRSETKTWIARQFAALAEQLRALPEPPALGEAELALIAALEPARPAAVSEDQLLDQIYADPSRDDARAVYADLLSSRGDPRGEFIALSLAPKLGKDQRARIKDLLREHQIHWLGELADIMLATDLEYARGFPTAGCLDGGASGAGIVRLTGAPAWRTFTRLDIRGDRPGYPDFLAHEVFHGLEELTTASPSALVRFDDAAPRALRRLVLSGDPEGLPPAVLDGRALPALTTLGVLHWTRHEPLGAVEEILDTPLGARLTRLEILQSPEGVGGFEDWIVALLSAKHDLRELVVSAAKSFRHAAGFHYELTRGAGGWTIHATYKTRPKKPDNFGLLATLLPRLRELPIVEVVVKTPRYELEDRARTVLRHAARGIELRLA